MLWQCQDKRGTRLGLWHLSLPGVWHMTWCCTGKTAAPYSCSRTTMSSRRFSWLPLLIPKKFKVKMSKTVVSSDQIVQTSWQLTAYRNFLRMNLRTSRERMKVPLWRTELWRQIPGRRWVDWFISAFICWRTYAYRNRLKTNERSSRQRRKVLLWSLRTEIRRWFPRRWWENRFISYLIWHSSESRNRLKSPGRSFPRHQSISWPSGRRL